MKKLETLVTEHMITISSIKDDKKFKQQSLDDDIREKERAVLASRQCTRILSTIKFSKFFGRQKGDQWTTGSALFPTV